MKIIYTQSDIQRLVEKDLKDKFGEEAENLEVEILEGNHEEDTYLKDLKEQAKALGVDIKGRLSKETLLQRIEEAKANQKKEEEEEDELPPPTSEKKLSIF